ncbi:lectin C-type domain protein [Cooperia oncophora]
MMLLLLGLLPLISAFTCPPNTIYHAEFNRCYKFSPDTLPFYMAEEACQSLGGHLVSFQEGLENAMVAETAQQQRIGSPFWIGLNKLNGDTWSYTDDSQVSFTNWQNANQSSSGPSTCAVSTLPDGTWQSIACSQSRAYVCAISTIVPVVTCPPCPTMFLWASFENAENICQGNGGHLASIHSLEENNFVATLGMSGITYTNDDDLTWIGLKQVNYPNSKDWTWTDGSPVDYLYWAPTQPDDAGGSEHCVEVFSDHTGKDPSKDGNYLRWNDMPCATNMRSYVCKKASIQ